MSIREKLEVENTEITEGNDELVFLTPMDIAKVMDCSVPTARLLFYRDDFPGLKIGKKGVLIYKPSEP